MNILNDYGDFLKCERRRQEYGSVTSDIVSAHFFMEQNMLDKKIAVLDRLCISIDRLSSSINNYKPPTIVNIIIDKDIKSSDLKKLIESLS